MWLYMQPLTGHRPGALFHLKHTGGGRRCEKSGIGWVTGLEVSCSGAHAHSAAVWLMLKQYLQWLAFAFAENAKLHSVWSMCPQAVF